MFLPCACVRVGDISCVAGEITLSVLSILTSLWYCSVSALHALQLTFNEMKLNVFW